MIRATPAEIAFAHTVEENNRQRFLVRRAAAARRRHRTSEAGSFPSYKPACTPAGRSLPSGPSENWRITALAIAVSVVVLPVALIGFIGISAGAALWQRITRRG